MRWTNKIQCVWCKATGGRFGRSHKSSQMYSHKNPQSTFRMEQVEPYSKWMNSKKGSSIVWPLLCCPSVMSQKGVVTMIECSRRECLLSSSVYGQIHSWPFKLNWYTSPGVVQEWSVVIIVQVFLNGTYEKRLMILHLGSNMEGLWNTVHSAKPRGLKDFLSCATCW